MRPATPAEYVRIRGWTAGFGDLAAVIGVDRGSLHRFLAGDVSRIGKDKREKLAAALRFRKVATLLSHIEKRRVMKGTGQ